MKCAFLFPGQGSQYPGMLQDLPKHPQVFAVIEEASRILGVDITQFDHAEALKSTVAVQLALLICGVATARVLITEGTAPDMVAGHSLGAFAAAVIAGVIEFKDALRLVKQRGEWMEQAYPCGYGMGIVLGMDERTLTAIVERVTTADAPVFLANRNAPDQIAVSGSLSSLEKLLDTARMAGARKTMLLNVGVPSHSPLMKDVSDQLAKAMEVVPFTDPRIPYGGIYKARTLFTAAEIRNDLAISTSAPVRWHEITTLFYEKGVRLFVEMQPGDVLTDLATNAFPEARALSISKSGVPSAVILSKRMKEKWL